MIYMVCKNSSLVPRPLLEKLQNQKIEKGSGNTAIQVQLRLANWYVIKSMPKLTLCHSDVAERKNGSKKLLLKQSDVAEAFASGRDASINFPTSYSKNICHRYISTAEILRRAADIA